jgi:hypothetical protein
VPFERRAKGDVQANDLPDQEEICRLRAEQCRGRAEEARGQDEEKLWRALAEEWLRLADHNARIRMTVPPVTK